jgi:hypothetical protein
MVLPLGLPQDAREVFRKVFRRLGINHPVPSFQVEYRPFTGLRSVIRLCKDRVEVHISDVLLDAPPLVLEALAEILVAQIYRRRPSREARECYLAYVFRPAVRGRIDDLRRQRSSKRLLPPHGRTYDLEKIFKRLNQQFFDGELVTPRLGWSLKRSRTVLGHYDSAHTTIIISRLLDSPAIPHYLLEYIMFHEMLHIRYPTERHGHRRVIHSREFREAEKRFPQYEQARHKMKNVCC